MFTDEPKNPAVNQPLVNRLTRKKMSHGSLLNAYQSEAASAPAGEPAAKGLPHAFQSEAPCAQAAEPAAKRSRKAVDEGEGLARYKMGSLLGEGGFASVRLATDPSGRLVAVKQIDRQRTSAMVSKREAGLLEGVGSHRHVVALITHFATPLTWVLVLELAAGGEVMQTRPFLTLWNIWK